MRWTITNEGEADITLDSITIVWPTENGELRKIRLDGVVIDNLDHPASSTAVSSGWMGVVGDRVFAPHESLELKFEFENQVLWTY